MMNGYKYGAESWTMVPIISTLPQLVLVMLLLKAVKAAGNKLSKDSTIGESSVATSRKLR